MWRFLNLLAVFLMLFTLEAVASVEIRPGELIKSAILNLLPGDTLLFRAGTYTDGEIWLRDAGFGGTPGNYKTLKAYPGEKVIIDSRRGFIVNGGAGYLRFEDFTLINASIRGGGPNIQIRNCDLLGNIGFGAWELSGDSMMVENNRFVLTSGRSGTMSHPIYLKKGDNQVIRNNFIDATRSVGGYGIHVYAGDHVDDNSKNLLIEGNYIRSSRERSGILLTKNRDGVIIRNNVIEDCREYGIMLKNEVTNIEIYHNTIITPSLDELPFIWEGDRAHIDVEVQNPDIKIKIMNNIFYYSGPDDNRKWFHIQVAQATWPLGIEVTNNLYAPGIAPKIRLMGPKRSGHWETILATFPDLDIKAVVSDPAFISLSDTNHSLMPKSPAIDAGVDLGLSYDKDGHARPQGQGYDIGAFEYQSGVSVKDIISNVKTSFFLTVSPTLMKGHTSISFKVLGAVKEVELAIYNGKGRLIKTLVNKVKSAGYYNANWDGTNLDGNSVPTGAYFVHYRAGSQRFVRKLMVLP